MVLASLWLREQEALVSVEIRKSCSHNIQDTMISRDTGNVLGKNIAAWPASILWQIGILLLGILLHPFFGIFL